MMPMKKASSDMKSAASPRKETTRLRALATGLRFTITASPKTSMSAEASQKKTGDIKEMRSAECGMRTGSGAAIHRTFRIPNCALRISFLLVPFQDHPMHDAADLEELLFIVHHFVACESGNGVIFAQENRLFRADLFAHPAGEAADHVDVEFFRVFFDLGKPVA